MYLTGLGEIYFQQGLSEKALAKAHRAQSLSPNRVESLIALSSLWSYLQQFNKSLECLHKALACVHGKKRAHYAAIQAQIGTSYGSLGQDDVALTWHHRARATYEKLNLTKKQLILEAC